MEQHLGSTFYSGARNTILRSEWWFIKKEWFDIRRSLLCRHSSFSPLLGEEDYLTSPKNACIGGYAKGSAVLFFINHYSDLKMSTSPLKLCLLPTSTPSYNPDFMFQSRRRNEILKQGRQVYTFRSYLLRLERMCFTLTWFLCSCPMSLPSLACPSDFHEESVHIFYWQRLDAGDHATNNKTAWLVI